MEMDTAKIRALLDKRDEIGQELASIFAGTKERKAQRCSRCQQEGHSARTCPQKE